MTVICVDLSRYQVGFDMKAFKDSGGLGVILKASEGTTIKDSAYDEHRANAKAAGLSVASYHFFRPSDPVAQADWYLECAQPDRGERIVLDFEDSTVAPGSGITFLQRIAAQRPDLQLTVYTGHVGEEREQIFGRNEWLAENTSLWTCQCASSPSPWANETWPHWSLWQYTDQGTVPGFVGTVDCNKFNGTDENFLHWMGPAAYFAWDEAPEEAPVVTLEVSSDKPVALKLVLAPSISFLGTAA